MTRRFIQFFKSVGVMVLSTFCMILPQSQLKAQSLDFPTRQYGLSFGNSAYFTGLRINWSDRGVDKISGLNVSLWRAKDNEDATMNGINLGLFMPEGGNLTGINIGGVGVAAHEDLTGLNFGLIDRCWCRGIS